MDQQEGITAHHQPPYSPSSAEPSSLRYHHLPSRNLNTQSCPERPSYLRMSMHNRPPAPMPRREQDAAIAAFVLNVLQSRDEVRNTSEAEDETSEGGPGAGEGYRSAYVFCIMIGLDSLGGVPAMIVSSCQCPHVTSRAVCGRRGLLEVR